MVKVRWVVWCVVLSLFTLNIPLYCAQGVININTATKEELMMLPGIGEKTAAAIVTYRLANGQFKSLDDMTRIKGISKKRIDKIRPYLVLKGLNTYIPSQTQGPAKENRIKDRPMTLKKE
ncbi:MAG: helix-hairpin-helix domain-containing protein [Desulfomonilia bacterium]|jgi:competence protein ComEA